MKKKDNNNKPEEEKCIDKQTIFLNKVLTKSCRASVISTPVDTPIIKREKPVETLVPAG